MSRVRYFAVRTVYTIVVLWIVISFLFVLFRLMPGDPTVLMAEAGAGEEATREFYEKWGLDEPLYVQYYLYMMNLLTGDLGQSFHYNQPVSSFVAQRMFNSFILAAPAITAGYVIGSIWGTIIGSKQGTKFDRYGITAAIFIGTIPIFFLSILAVILFSSHLGVFPTGGMHSADFLANFDSDRWWASYLTGDFLWHYTLPFAVIAFRYTYLPTLLMRTSVVEVKEEGFSFYFRATGLPTVRRLAHLARHASLPVITFYPLSLTRAIGGLVLVEFVFNWPGIGIALVNAVFFRDFPVIMAVFMAVAAFILFGNFLVDIVYGIVDPRVTVGEGGS